MLLARPLPPVLPSLLAGSVFGSSFVFAWLLVAFPWWFLAFTCHRLAFVRLSCAFFDSCFDSDRLVLGFCWLAHASWRMLAFSKDCAWLRLGFLLCFSRLCFACACVVPGLCFDCSSLPLIRAANSSSIKRQRYMSPTLVITPSVIADVPRPQTCSER